jgi:hypothetical protein
MGGQDLPDWQQRHIFVLFSFCFPPVRGWMPLSKHPVTRCASVPIVTSSAVAIAASGLITRRLPISSGHR